MKKLIPLSLIIIALIFVTIGSEIALNRHFSILESLLTDTETVLSSDDLDAALRVATECVDYYDNCAGFLVFFVPNETLTLFEVTIQGMQCYIEEENRTEALAEAARAHAHLSAIETLYFRAV